jgi:hypothetical protein
MTIIIIGYRQRRHQQTNELFPCHAAHTRVKVRYYAVHRAEVLGTTRSMFICTVQKVSVGLWAALKNHVMTRFQIACMVQISAPT